MYLEDNVIFFLQTKGRALIGMVLRINPKLTFVCPLAEHVPAFP